MSTVVTIFQVIVAISILNVWLVNYSKPSQWRGGNAQNIFEEFQAYGLPNWLCYVVGFLKVGLALAILASIYFDEIRVPSALGLGALLMGSIVMHIKIKDSFKKSFPAILFLLMSLYIAFPLF